MKTVKMKISGISINDPLTEPLVILKSRRGDILPLLLDNIDRTTILRAMINQDSGYSEIISKLLKLSDIEIKKILLSKVYNGKLAASVYTGSKKHPFEVSVGASILLCLETGIDLTIDSELLNETTFFRNKIDEKKIFEQFNKFLTGDISDQDQITKVQIQIKETVQ